MYLVQERVSLLYDLIVLRVLGVGSIGYDDSGDFVDLGGETFDADESREFSIEKVHGYAECLGHGLERNALIRLQ